MTKKIFITIISIIISFSAFSQNEYKKGFIIKNNNDTIYGYLKDRKISSFGKLYKKIRFKNNKNVLFYKNYSPYQISGYKIGYTEFDSKWIYTTNSFLTIIYKNETNLGEKVFLKVEQRGFVTYYKWEQEDPENGYVEAMDLFLRKDKDHFVRIYQGIFGLKKNKLAKYFIDCPVLGNLILTNQIKDPFDIVYYYNSWKKANP